MTVSPLDLGYGNPACYKCIRCGAAIDEAHSTMYWARVHRYCHECYSKYVGLRLPIREKKETIFQRIVRAWKETL